MVVAERRPSISVDSLNISPKPVLESLELARNRQIINGGSISDIARLFHVLSGEVLEKDGYKLSTLGTYEMFRLIAKKLPDRMSEEQQRKALLATRDSNPIISKEGRDAFFLLKIKTILSSADWLYIESIDNRDDRDDMTQTGALSLAEKLSSIDLTHSISEQVQNIVRLGVVKWAADKDGVPAEWIRNPLDRKNIAEILDELSEGNTRHVTIDQIKKIISDERFSHIPVSSFTDYIRDLKLQMHNRDAGTMPDEENGVFDLAVRALLEDQVEGVLGTLNGREKRVIRLRFNLVEPQEVSADGRQRTREEIARKMNLSPPTVNKAYGSAMRKLRHPIRRRRLEGYIGRSPKRQERKFGTDYYLIENLNLDKDLKDRLKIFGIVGIEDFLIKKPEELMEAWKKAGSKERDLIRAIGETVFNSLSLKETFEALHLDIILDRQFLARAVRKMLGRKDVLDLLIDLNMGGFSEKEKQKIVFIYGLKSLWEFYFWQKKRSKAVRKI